MAICDCRTRTIACSVASASLRYWTTFCWRFCCSFWLIRLCCPARQPWQTDVRGLCAAAHKRAFDRNSGVCAVAATAARAGLAPVGRVRELDRLAELLDHLVALVGAHHALRLGEHVPGHDHEAARVAAHGFVLLEGEQHRRLALAVAALADEPQELWRMTDLAQAGLETLVDVAKAR